MLDDTSATTRIRPDDELIDGGETRAIMGGMSVSALYDDPELMGLKIKIGDGTSRQCRVRFIKREVLGLRAQRVARSEANAPAIRAQVEKRLALRREKRRMRASTTDHPYAQRVHLDPERRGPHSRKPKRRPHGR